MIGIVDYGMGNLGSVKHKLEKNGIQVIVSSKPDDLLLASKLILPGVGHFSKAVSELQSRGLWDFLNDEVITRRKPILGICLGMQLMTSISEEGNIAGFGWFDAKTVRFQVNNPIRYKVPHMGWNDIEILKHTDILSEVELTSGFYFVHSYHVICNDKNDILCETTYEYPFTSAIIKNNIVGFQFHPEKSHDAGESILLNFSKL